MKKRINIRFDEDLWSKVKGAAKKTKRSATAYLEYSAEEQLKRDFKNVNDLPVKKSQKKEI